MENVGKHIDAHVRSHDCESVLPEGLADNPAGRDYGYRSDAFYSKLAELRRKRRRRKVGLVVVGVILALFVGAGVAVGVYLHTISSAMSMGDEAEELKKALAEADTNKPFYMLLVGSDWRENSGVTDIEEMSGDQQRADVIMLARVDRPGKQVTLISIPRDTPYKKADGTYCKINEVYNEGRSAGITTAISELTGARISHYAEVYFSDFENLIDAIGGVEIDMKSELTGTDPLTDEKIVIKAGKQTLTGKEAMLLARERKSYDGNQDGIRQGKIREIVEAMMKRVQKLPATDLPGVVYGAASCVKTDMPVEEILFLANDFRGGVTMYNGSGPSEGQNVEELDGMWLCYEDPEGWERLMNVVDSGGDPSDVSYSGDVAKIPGTSETVIIE